MTLILVTITSICIRFNVMRIVAVKVLAENILKNPFFI